MGNSFFLGVHVFADEGVTSPVFKGTQNVLYRPLLKTFLPVLLVASAQASETFMARVTAVPDGDTLWVQPEGGAAPRKLRLQGIDAPEICQGGGVAARDALQRLVGTQRFKVVVLRYDDYGRGLARLQVGDVDIGAAMVRSGQAWSYRWHRSLGPYADEESTARRSKVGVFAQINPEQPRDFRKRHGSCYPEK